MWFCKLLEIVQCALQNEQTCFILLFAWLNMAIYFQWVEIRNISHTSKSSTLLNKCDQRCNGIKLYINCTLICLLYDQGLIGMVLEEEYVYIDISLAHFLSIILYKL